MVINYYFHTVIKQLSQKLRQGVNYQESKYYSPNTVEIGFPMITGVQFTQSYEEPTVAHLSVQAKGHFDQEKEGQDNYKVPINAATNGKYQVVFVLMDFII